MAAAGRYVRHGTANMNITLMQVKSPEDFETPELKNRAKESTRSKITIHYKASVDGREVAFLALDRWPELGAMAVYEIFVPLSVRRQGIATAVLKETERITACEGLSLVRVRPYSFDHGITREALFNWYDQQGYVRDSNIPGELFKIVDGGYWYAFNHFNKAVHILAIGTEDVRGRLLDVWKKVLKDLEDDRLPDDLQKDFIWIKTQLHKYNESYPGELASLQRWDKMDPIFRTKFPYPDPVEATLKRIRKRTAARIARKIYGIYDGLKARGGVSP